MLVFFAAIYTVNTPAEPKGEATPEVVKRHLRKGTRCKEKARGGSGLEPRGPCGLSSKPSYRWSTTNWGFMADCFLLMVDLARRVLSLRAFERGIDCPVRHYSPYCLTPIIAPICVMSPSSEDL